MKTNKMIELTNELLKVKAVKASDWVVGSRKNIKKKPLPLFAIEINRQDYTENFFSYKNLPREFKKEVAAIFSNTKAQKVITFSISRKKIEKIIETIILLEWKKVVKSPYSCSYYSTNNISWGYKEENSYRLSDHWNFYNRDEFNETGPHCKLNYTKEKVDKLMICQYRQGVYYRKKVI